MTTFTHTLLTNSHGHIDAQLATSEEDALRQARERLSNVLEDNNIPIDVSNMSIEQLSHLYVKDRDDEDGWMQIAPIWNNPLEGRKLGLPTFPILDGMMIGSKRDAFALEWLLDHGVFQSDTRYYKKISKVSPMSYHLVYNSGSDDEEELIAGVTDLQTLLQIQKINLQSWLWYSND